MLSYGIAARYAVSFTRVDTSLLMLLGQVTGLETHGPLGTLWVSLGLIAFYIALIWINSLLGHFLTPLFLIPATWLMDAIKRRKTERGAKR